MSRPLVVVVAVCIALLSIPRWAGATEDGKRTDFAVLPGLTLSSDTGLGGGLTAAIFRREPGKLPFAFSARLSIFATTGGVQDHSLALDVPGIAGSAFRPTLGLALFRDANRPYFGIENATTETRPSGAADDYFTYVLTSIRADVGVEYRLAPGWYAWLSYGFRTLGVDVPPSSKLEQDNPAGAFDSRSARLELELAHDTRDTRNSTISGHLLALSSHLAHPFLGSAFEHGGFAAEARLFRAPLRFGVRLVLALRLLMSFTWGDIPVGQLTLFGGRSNIEGLGGGDTLRGVPRHRWLGPHKMVANTEVRSRLLRLKPYGKTLDLWGALFIDAGRVWAPGAVDDGPWWRLHATAGAGLRIAFVEDFVVRIDAGFATDSWGFYTGIGQLF